MLYHINIHIVTITQTNNIIHTTTHAFSNIYEVIPIIIIVIMVVVFVSDFLVFFFLPCFAKCNHCTLDSHGAGCFAGYELLICCYLVFLEDGLEFPPYLVGGVSFGVFNED